MHYQRTRSLSHSLLLRQVRVNSCNSWTFFKTSVFICVKILSIFGLNLRYRARLSSILRSD